MSSVTKAKINIREGTIELEGNETFVTKQIEIFMKKIEGLNLTLPTDNINTEKIETENISQEGTPEKKRRRKNATPRIVQPISLDLKKTDKKPSLKEFYLQKKPNSNMEKATVFAYYLKKYLNTPQIEPGHMVSCCRDVKAKVPNDIGMTFYNAQKLYAWLKLDDKGKAEISIQGENMVEALPRKKDDNPNKATT